MQKLLLGFLFIYPLLLSYDVIGQGFIAAVEDDGIGSLYGNPCILKLASGEEIQGKFAGGMYVKNGLTKITIKLENGEKAKFVPEQVISLHIHASRLMKLFIEVFDYGINGIARITAA